MLGYADRSGRVIATALYERLHLAAVEIKPVMICIDTVADSFAGSEIDRSQVRQFIGMLSKLAISADGYVAIASHPSLTGTSSGSGGIDRLAQQRQGARLPDGGQDQGDDEPDLTADAVVQEKLPPGREKHRAAMGRRRL